jgi:uncharacterized protein (TIGR01777 family)
VDVEEDGTMRVVIAGGSGLIGSALTRALLTDGHAVVVLTRDAARAGARLPARAQAVTWDLQPGGAWETALDGGDAVVNLAGATVAGLPWTAARKRRIRDSRITATTALVAALAAPNRPRVLVNASAVGYYGDGGDAPLPESAPAGHDFLASVVVDWEAAARTAEAHGVRVAMIRTGIVLSPAGGALTPIVLPFRFFLGGVMGRPEQWVPWIHIDDEIGLFRLALENPAASGPINAAGPAPVTMAAFSHTIGRLLHRPTWLPGAAFGMKLLLQEQADVVLASLKVVPAAAERHGYRFRYPTHEAALREVLLGEQRDPVAANRLPEP